MKSTLTNGFSIAYEEKAKKIIERSQKVSNALLESTSVGFLINDISFEEWTNMKQEFFSEYILSSLKNEYFKTFPTEKQFAFENVLNETKEIGKFDTTFLLDEKRRFNYVFLIWLEENGFIHEYKEHIYIIDFDGTDFAFFISGNIPVKKFNLLQTTVILNGLIDKLISKDKMIENTRKRKALLEILLISVLLILIILIIRYFKKA